MASDYCNEQPGKERIFKLASYGDMNQTEAQQICQSHACKLPILKNQDDIQDATDAGKIKVFIAVLF